MFRPVDSPHRRATSPGGLPFLAGAAIAVLGVAAIQSAIAPPAALAQLPDSAAQRVEMLNELKTGNQRLAEIAGLLREIRDQRPPPTKDGRAAESPRK